MPKKPAVRDKKKRAADWQTRLLKLKTSMGFWLTTIPTQDIKIILLIFLFLILFLKLTRAGDKRQDIAWILAKYKFQKFQGSIKLNIINYFN